MAATSVRKRSCVAVGCRRHCGLLAQQSRHDKLADRLPQAAGNRGRDDRVAILEIGQLDECRDFFLALDRRHRNRQLKANERVRKIGHADQSRRQRRRVGQRGAASRIACCRTWGSPSSIARNSNPSSNCPSAWSVDRACSFAWGSRLSATVARNSGAACASPRSTNKPLGRVATPAVGRFKLFDQLTRRVATHVRQRLGRPGALAAADLPNATVAGALPPIDAAAQRLGHECRMLDPAAIEVDDVQRCRRARWSCRPDETRDRSRPETRGRARRGARRTSAPSAHQHPAMHQVGQRFAERRRCPRSRSPVRRRDRSSARTARCNSRYARD